MVGPEFPEHRNIRSLSKQRPSNQANFSPPGLRSLLAPLPSVSLTEGFQEPQLIHLTSNTLVDCFTKRICTAQRPVPNLIPLQKNKISPKFATYSHILQFSSYSQFLEVFVLLVTETGWYVSLRHGGIVAQGHKHLIINFSASLRFSLQIPQTLLARASSDCWTS